MRRPAFHRLVLPAALLAALSGCAALDAPSTRPVRSPSVVVRDGGARHARALPRHVVRETRADAARYAEVLDRALRLDRRQERAVRALVTDRALDFMQRQPYAERRALFPRRLAERTREGARWWDRTDKKIERVLTKRQRRAYRDLVREADARDHRRGRGRKKGHDIGRGHHRGHDDDRRDRDDWDDDRDDWDDGRYDD